MTRQERFEWVKTAILCVIVLFFFCVLQQPFWVFWTAVLGGYCTHRLTQRGRERRR